MVSPSQKLKAYWQKRGAYDKFLLLVALLYLGIVGFFLMLHQAPYSPDQFYIFALVFAIIVGEGKRFIRDWTPPILLLLMYEYVRGIIPKLNPHVHWYFMIHFDEFIFGKLPSVYLQNLLFNAMHLHWYDYTCAFLYEAFYVVPLFIAFILWLNHRKDFEKFIFSMVGLSYLGYLTYIIFPAAPPWLASQQGLIPTVTHITPLVFTHFFNFIALPTAYTYIGTNLYAAVPSLHAAWPFLTMLLVWKTLPKLRPWLILYTAAVAFAVVYLGEHYVFDVLLGMLYAIIIYFIGLHWNSIINFIRRILHIKDKTSAKTI